MKMFDILWWLFWYLRKNKKTFKIKCAVPLDLKHIRWGLIKDLMFSSNSIYQFYQIYYALKSNKNKAYFIYL